MPGRPIRPRPAVLAAFLFLGCRFAAAEDLLFEIEDPFRDDRGAGSLVYPLRSDFEVGDLDLLAFSALRRDDGTVFRAVFANAIRPPGKEAIDGLGTSRDQQARLGFYTLNLDVYIDTDRRPGSGNVAMLPGRLAEVAPPHAWEKVVAVTPRPEALRASIKRLRVREWKEEESRKRQLTRGEVRRRKKQISEELMPLVFFPTQVRVKGRALEFFVPREFLGGDADPAWAYVVAVTGARLDQRFSVPLGWLGKYPEESSDGLVLPVVPGRDREAFGGGRESDPLQPPIIDILVPPGDTQERILDDYSSEQERPAQIPGVVPAEM